MGGMDLDQMLTVLRCLDAEGIRYWVAGGWGVDVLVGRQTRAHRDLDLAVDMTAPDDERRAMAALAGLGFVIETDWRPTRVELRAPGDQWVDVHPVVFDEHGDGRQADLDGGWFEYPAHALTAAAIGGTVIACLSSERQLRFHEGYPPRDIDLHDVALLRGIGRVDQSPSGE
jgi:lincosamide nucleotidyltransferase A/C/D/E